MKGKLLFTDALSFWLREKNITQGELAKRMGVTPNSISQYKTGERTPPMDRLEDLAGALGVTLPEFFARGNNPEPDAARLETVRARPRADAGGVEAKTDHGGPCSFRAAFLARKGGTAKTMKLFEVAGDSMEPLLADGDLIMVNTKETEVRSGRVYLVRIGGELMAKRLETRPGGVLVIRSDNPAYEDVPVNAGEAPDVEVFGRMVWSCREY